MQQHNQQLTSSISLLFAFVSLHLNSEAANHVGMAAHSLQLKTITLSVCFYSSALCKHLLLSFGYM